MRAERRCRSWSWSDSASTRGGTGLARRSERSRATSFVILGVLNTFGPLSGYGVKQVIAQTIDFMDILPLERVRPASVAYRSTATERGITPVW